MATVGVVPSPRTEEYKYSRDREVVRSTLAVLLIGLVIIEILGLGIAGLTAVFQQATAAEKVVTAIKDIASLLLTPSIALASAVMGFYYANNTNSP